MKCFIAIPVLDDGDELRACLENLAVQTYADFQVHVCVNQPNDWWEATDRRAVCERNVATLAWLASSSPVPVRTVDRCTRGTGWRNGRGGVGHARRVLMDGIAGEAADDALIVSLDADVRVPPDYLERLVQAFGRVPGASGITVPYLHRLNGAADLDRAILRYECYLRHYAINLWRAGSPYAFTALGSALALPVMTYRGVGGIPTRQCGEDFYLLQKIVKHGGLLHWADTCVFPSGRESWRVPFGTGPAVTRGRQNEWEPYPIVAPGYFDDIRETIRAFPDLFREERQTPLGDFLRGQLGTDDVWGPLRRNHRDRGRFVRACHERLDGLRTFQYLRTRGREGGASDEENIVASLRRPDAIPGFVGTGGEEAGPEETGLRKLRAQLTGAPVPGWSFAESDVGFLDGVRRLLMSIEHGYRFRDFREKEASGEC